MFPIGTKIVYNYKNKLAYEKVGENLWVALDAYFYVTEQHLNPENNKMENVDVKYWERDTPMFKKDGSLNHTGFKWSDDMVKKYFETFATFKTPQ
jgi:hypothetical protein